MTRTFVRCASPRIWEILDAFDDSEAVATTACRNMLPPGQYDLEIFEEEGVSPRYITALVDTDHQTSIQSCS